MNLQIKEAIIRGETSLGIEFGSTRIKATLIDYNFETIGSSSTEWENQLVNGYWTYDFDEMISKLQATYRKLKQEVEDRYDVKLENIGSIGCSAMMQGYIVINQAGELLVPFRTWRNSTTGCAARDLTNIFQFKIPERWSIAHLYQAILNEEEHVVNIDYMTTLSGYVHWLLTGSKYLGVCDASGMFPISESKRQFNQNMMEQFSDLIADKGYSWVLKDILPEICTVGEPAGNLSKAGARLLDPTGDLFSGIPLCPPEGDAGTGMVATNSLKQCTGNISVGTSIFAMIALEKDLSAVYPEIDIISTPDGNPVAMVLANNGSSDINAWVSLFIEFYKEMKQKPDKDEVFNILFYKALKADADGGGLLSYGYYSGENITGFEKGRPLFVRTPESRFNLANFMRTHFYTAFAALRLGLDILTEKEHMKINNILAHGGLFKTPLVAQKMCSAALNIPVSVMPTAGEGGPWGMAVLASYMMHKKVYNDLDSFLAQKVFNGSESEEVKPDSNDVVGFDLFLNRYKAGLKIEQAAIDHFT